DLELLTNPNIIKNEVNKHSQKIWWGSTKSRNTIDEKWFKLVESLPNNKAPGPSNEMIKYAGQKLIEQNGD
ncbi:2861_t:CDS:2, partial [Entrophospora sp. SA101]